MLMYEMLEKQRTEAAIRLALNNAASVKNIIRCFVGDTEHISKKKIQRCRHFLMSHFPLLISLALDYSSTNSWMCFCLKEKEAIKADVLVEHFHIRNRSGLYRHLRRSESRLPSPCLLLPAVSSSSASAALPTQPSLSSQDIQPLSSSQDIHPVSSSQDIQESVTPQGTYTGPSDLSRDASSSLMGAIQEVSEQVRVLRTRDVPLKDVGKKRWHSKRS